MTGSNQPTPQGGNNFQPSWPENAGDLIKYLNNADNAGEQTRLFFKLAEEKPGVAFRVFVTILRNQASLPRRALALRGFGKITDPAIKQAIASCQSEDSQELLKWLSEELKGKGEISRDLTCWAAADAIQGIEFPPEYLHHSALGNLSEPPERIAQEIVERNIKQIYKIQRLNGRGERTVEYQRYLEFWIYGPTQELLKEKNTSPNYEAIVRDVLWQLQALGVMFGLGSDNQTVQEIAIEYAKIIYSKIEDNEKHLYEYLAKYLKNKSHSIELRIRAINIINMTGNWKPITEKLNLMINVLFADKENIRIQNVALDELNKQYKISPDTQKFLYEHCRVFVKGKKYDLELRIRIISLINSTGDWKHVKENLKLMVELLSEDKQDKKIQDIALHELETKYNTSPETEKYLYEDLTAFINERKYDIELRIKLIKVINNTGNWNIRNKLIFLINLLLTEVNSEKLFDIVLELLYKQKQELDRVDKQAGILVDGLYFDYSLDKSDKSDNPEKLTLADIEERIASSKKYKDQVSEIFSQSQQAALVLVNRYKKLHSSIIKLLEDEQNPYLKEIERWINILTNIKNDIKILHDKNQSNQRILNDAMNYINTEIKLDSVKTDLDSLTNDITELCSLNKEKNLKYNLMILKNDVLKELNSTKNNLLEESQRPIRLLIICGISIMLVTYFLSPPLSNWFQHHSPTPDWFQSSSDTSVNTNNTISTPWYLSGFPKKPCGSSYSNNNCWYRVFIEYSDRNWSKVMSNHCQDIGEAQNQKTAKSIGEIQVASFSNLEEAQGFANYMKTQYGSGRVGQLKCL